MSRVTGGRAQPLSDQCMKIEYKINAPITTHEFIEVLRVSGLGERRPVEDMKCKGMIANSNLIASAWDGEALVGIARAITDFYYACYLSGLAVSKSHQRLGIGKSLQSVLQQQLGPKCKLILLAAPAASSYYGALEYTSNPRGWVLERDVKI